MSEFQSYSFSRLFLNRNIEFFFLQGVNNQDDFTEFYDLRVLEVVGYILIYNNHEEQKNFIYLIDKEDRDFDSIIKYTKQFINQMTLSDKLSDRENFEILTTDVNGRVVSPPYKNFIKNIVKNEIPESVLDELE